MIEIKNLYANIEGKEILKGINLTIKSGETHAIMGPNGAGKSTLSYVIMGHPKYEVTKGEILIDGENVLEMTPNERAQKGLFMSFQYPMEVPGVTIASFLKTAYSNLHGNISALDFKRLLEEKMDMLNIDRSFISRGLNEGFSGGEKKRNEILQMAVLKPKFAILDETDSGLDVDSLRIVSEGINKIKSDSGILMITHYNRILNYVKPDFVHVLVDGKIEKSGGSEIAEAIESGGYKNE